jgi:metal transporter CNNM
MLDCVLGDEVVSYDRKRLMELIKLSTKNASGTPAEELKIAIGALEMGDKTVKDVMTKIDVCSFKLITSIYIMSMAGSSLSQDVFMLSQETDLNSKVVAEILRSGYTRIPVYAKTRDNVVSLLFVKDLALLDPDDNFAVREQSA